MGFWSELEAKRLHDGIYRLPGHAIWVDGPIVIGAGPSGLAVAACLKQKGIGSLILERSDCIAPLWKHKTYDRLRLHLPKQFCQLPLMPFPSDFPTYPTKQQFLEYVEDYARHFGISPVFNQAVESAEFDVLLGMWRVRTTVREYLCPWLVVATGENAEAAVPEMEGIGEFEGPVVHSSDYRSGDVFSGKKVLVVGCGNSGMEVCLDLCNFTAHPTMVVREAVHILPREMLGLSTFGLSMLLLNWLSLRTVDKLLLLLSRLLIGDTNKCGLPRPELGPLELKSISGKTPVLDVGALAKIKSGEIKISPGVKRFVRHGAEFVDGSFGEFDAVVMATGYRSNVPSWLKEREFFSEKDGMPRKPFPSGWKGENGLYAVGFSKRGIQGASIDAQNVAGDIEQCMSMEARRAESLCYAKFYQLRTSY